MLKNHTGAPLRLLCDDGSVVALDPEPVTPLVWPRPSLDGSFHVRAGRQIIPRTIYTDWPFPALPAPEPGVWRIVHRDAFEHLAVTRRDVLTPRAPKRAGEENLPAYAELQAPA